MTSIDKPLKNIISSTGLIFIGSITGFLLQFFSGIVVVRAINPTEYGFYNLAFTIINCFTLVSVLGIDSGIPQLMSKYISAKNFEKTWGGILSSIFIVGLLSTFYALGIYGLSGFIAGVFKKPEMRPILQVFTTIIPPMAILILLVSIFRGLSYSWPKVIFDEIGARSFKILGFLLVISMSWGLNGVIWTTVIGIYLTFAIVLIYAIKTIPKAIPRANPTYKITKELVIFSLPLFGNTIIYLLMTTTGTLFLGFFLPSDSVAKYYIASSLSRFVDMPLNSLAFIYLPITTSVFVSQNINTVTKLYISSTKWITLIAMPVFLFFLLDAEFFVSFLFGNSYLPSSEILRILAVGTFFHTALGPNGLTLLSIGKTKAVFLSTLIAAFLNITLGWFLIPLWNIKGAAVASCTAIIISNLLISLSLYKQSGIHLFTLSYIKPFACVFALAFLTYFSFNLSHTEIVLWHIIFFIWLFIICFSMPFITKSVDVTDMAIISGIERKLFRSSFATERLSKWLGIETTG